MPKDPLSPRLQSLLIPPTNQSLDNNEEKAQGIYAELVRRSRQKHKIGRTTMSTDPGKSDSLNVEHQKSPISSVVKRFAWQSSPAKRLERLRQLHREMNTQQKEQQVVEKESPLTRRLSPARLRATKSLKRNAVLKVSKIDTPRVAEHHATTDNGKDAVVQIYLPVSGSTDGEVKKLKKDAECRDMISLASSTRSHSLVAALPSAAKTRNAASGKPGR
jgi:hypothetical protein